jgi:hypothetical protein
MTGTGLPDQRSHPTGTLYGTWRLRGIQHAVDLDLFLVNAFPFYITLEMAMSLMFLSYTFMDGFGLIRGYSLFDRIVPNVLSF